jgi:hypothetical protein
MRMTLQDMRERAPARRAAGRPASPLHTPFAVLGGVVGLAVAFRAYDGGWTWPGIVLGFAVVSGIVGTLLPDVIVGPRRLARLAYRSLPIAAGVGGFALAGAWGPTWSALLVGGGLGAGVGVGLGLLLFRDLTFEDWRIKRAEATG